MIMDRNQFFHDFADPGKEYRPEVRWWLAEGFHTDETLRREIRLIDEAGFGAVEFLAMPEPGIDDKRYGWGSEEWIHDTAVLTEEATKRGLGVSYTSGTHWATANLMTIGPDDRAASKELAYSVEKLAADTARSGKLKRPEITVDRVKLQELEAVVAARILQETEDGIVLDIPGTDLTGIVKEQALSWTSPDDGDYLLFSFWIQGTGQTADPSAGISYTINYMDPDGMKAFTGYWSEKVLTEEMRDWIQHNGRVQMYMDSLELQTHANANQLWACCFLEEFRKRRGYVLTPYLPLLPRDIGYPRYVHFHYLPASGEVQTKLLRDVYQTMTDLYMENMLKPLQEWLHTMNMTSRAEISYGQTFEISQPGKYVDGIETESLEFCSQPEFYRSMAGSAHIYQRTFSSETGATMHNYQLSMDFYQQIIYTQFAIGVTRTVLHGWSSICGAEATTEWPGHEGMYSVFSERFGERQPSFRHYKSWNQAMARFQFLLRQGKPHVDLGILRTDYDIDNTLNARMRGHDELWFYEKRFLRNNEGFYWRDMTLQNNGYTYEYFSPKLLEEEFACYEKGKLFPNSPGYRALIVYQEGMTVSSARKLLALCEAGLPVLFADNCTEMTSVDVLYTHHEAAGETWSLGDDKDELREVVAKIRSCPSVHTVSDPALCKEQLFSAGIEPAVLFEAPNTSILSTVRELENGERIVYFYHYQYQGEPCSFWAGIEGGVPVRLDCWNGQSEEVAEYQFRDNRTWLKVSMNPGEAAVYLFSAPGNRPRDRERNRKPTVVNKLPLTDWTLWVESWERGEKKEIGEDRGLGYETTEIYYVTCKRRINAGAVALKPWKDIPKIGDTVSGIGHYSTVFRLPEQWDNNTTTTLEITSTNGGTAAVYVNGAPAGGYDFDRKKLDITGLLREGENHLEIEVATSLFNRLLSDGYYGRILFFASDQKDAYSDLEPVAYGLTGEVRIIF